MPASFRLAAVLLCLTVLTTGCQTDGSTSSGSGTPGTMSEKQLVESRRAAWPETNGDFSDPVNLNDYRVLTLIPFDNLTDNSKDDDAGTELVREVQKTLNNRYEDAFTTVRIADAPLGEADEIVASGFVYDFSKGGGFNYFSLSGRNKAKFKAMMALKNGATGQVVKSSRINQSGLESNDELLEEAGEKFARMLNRSLNGE